MLRFPVNTVALFSIFLCSQTFADKTIIVEPAAPAKSETVVVSPAPPAPSATTPSSGTVTNETIIVSPAPEAKETVETPSGYASCFTVQAGWYKDSWVPQHRICQYENMPGKVAWVEGYWACSKYDLGKAACLNWDWKPGHWAETLVIY